MDKKSKRPKAILKENGIPNVAEFANMALGDYWNIETFRKTVKVNVVKESDNENELEFDLIGCSAAIANAFRRILLSEIPSMAIEKVYISNNTSLIQDEVLAHRLGLIPLKADPRLFEYPPPNDGKEQTEVSDTDTLRYEMRVTCKSNPQASKTAKTPEELYINSNVYSKDIKWVPIGRQAEFYPQGEKTLGVLDENILICKMRPGQEIHVFMHAVKGIGKDHAKFSPVATAWYRMLPEIKITQPITGESAERFQKCFSPGVIELVKNKKGVQEARVKDARYDSCSRNVFMHDDLKDKVELTRAADHFIFTVESVGERPAARLFIEAVKVLKDKCRTFLQELNNEEKAYR